MIINLVGDLERIQTRRRELMTKIEEAFLDHPLGQVLNTLPGFGPRTGARTLAEIGDPYRFQNGSRLAAYAGLAPVNHRSGKRINRTSRHRGGNHRLKNAMFLAAFVASRHDPAAKAYYQRKRTEGKTPHSRCHLRRPTPLRPHPRHAQKPNLLQPPTQLNPPETDLTNR